jgi:hypothetical protein
LEKKKKKKKKLKIAEICVFTDLDLAVLVVDLSMEKAVRKTKNKSLISEDLYHSLL